MFQQQSKSKHPVKDAPLPVPGESLRDELLDRFLENFAWWFLLAVAMIFLMLLEWWRWWMRTPPAPTMMTLLTSPVIVYCVYRIVRGWPELKNLRTGWRGELSVGQELQESLPPLGYVVLHDIPGDGFNIDHVAIGPAGVFSIETKTVSKPSRGNPTVDYDGKTITVAGLIPDRDPVCQAQACARFLVQCLHQQTGARPVVRGVVVYPGWWVQQTVANPEIWVLNSKQLPGWMRQEPIRFSPTQITAAVEGLKRHVRSRRT